MTHHRCRPLLAALLLLLSCAAGASAGERIKIEEMSRTQLERLMGSTECRCMVVAMAAWCSPCRRELPVLAKLYSRYRSQGLRIVGISLDMGGPEAMQPIVDKAKVNFPVYWVGEQVIEDFDIYAIPMLFLIKEGKIVEKIPGKRSAKYLERKIQMLLE
jgi:thiol-disulfide isomerase/thioredoxin